MVSRRDRARMAAVARDLTAVESDVEVAGEALARVVDEANRDRARRGLSPLQDDALPEEGLYERARALGLRRISR